MIGVLRPYEILLFAEGRRDAPVWRSMVSAFSEDEAKEEAIRHFRSGFIFTKPPKIDRVEVLSDVHLDSGRKQQTLFEDLADACVGHSLKDIQGACVNLLITAVRRRYDKQADAEARWDELAGRGKIALAGRYKKIPEAANEDAAQSTEIANRILS